MHPLPVLSDKFPPHSDFLLDCECYKKSMNLKMMFIFSFFSGNPFQNPF